MKELAFSPRARRDIDEIWEYSAERWDIRQADTYVRLIASTCQRIAEGQLPGASAEDIRAGYRRQQVGSHVVFYQVRDDTIVVIRILHQRMDVPGHFE